MMLEEFYETQRWETLKHGDRESGGFIINCVNLPPVPKAVIPEAILIGNPALKLLKLWIPDKGIRG